jgi:hypothetical protein
MNKQDKQERINNILTNSDGYANSVCEKAILELKGRIDKFKNDLVKFKEEYKELEIIQQDMLSKKKQVYLDCPNAPRYDFWFNERNKTIYIPALHFLSDSDVTFMINFDVPDYNNKILLDYTIHISDGCGDSHYEHNIISLNDCEDLLEWLTAQHVTGGEIEGIWHKDIFIDSPFDEDDCTEGKDLADKIISLLNIDI